MAGKEQAGMKALEGAKEMTGVKDKMTTKEQMKTRETQGNAKGRTFRVTITETLKRTVTVHESELKEPTALDAEQTVRDWWRTGQIVLMAEDFSDVDFSVEEYDNGSF